ncbi:MAG: class I SAM-dependent methyltransferase [Pseudomonadota bacterium]
MSDLLSRSSAHWSEAGRAGMEAFYALATDDYRHLAQARDWRALFEEEQQRVGDQPLRLLDVACGSGKFPRALSHYCNLADAAIHPVETTLLDPSAFSINEARSALEPPFSPVAEVEATLQDFRPPETAYDIVWATHALYAIPQHELAAALTQFLAAIAPGGLGIIAHSAEAGHYVRFHQHYLAVFGEAHTRPYVSAETIVETLRTLGARVDVQEVHYDSVASIDQGRAVEGFLQRCVFDDRVGLSQMQATEPLASYLAGCGDSEAWRFGQRVWLITVAG